jgi:zinc protease
VTNSLLLAALLTVPAAAQPRATEKDRAKPAPLGTTAASAALTAVKDSIANGMTLSLIESHRLPLVAVTLIIPQAGAATDPVGKEGLSSFAAAMVKEGVPGLPNAAALSDAIDDLGATISVGASDSGVTVSVLVLKENLDQALGLVSRMVRSPNSESADAVSAAALERIRRQSLAGLEMEKGDPEALASKRLGKEVFGDDPHGRSATAATISAITPADVAARQRSGLVPNGAILAAAGDLTPEEFKALAEKNFGAWSPAALPAAPAAPTAVAVAVPSAAPSAASATTGPEIIVIDVPGEQAEMMLGVKVLPRAHPDYDALSLAVGVLGGPMIGRLDQNIRETHHWAYGARASLAAFADAGEVEMSSKVQVDKTGDALGEILGEAARIGNEPVPAAELTAAKTYLKGSYLQNTRTVQSLAARLAGLESLGLPASKLNDYAARMDALTAAQVQAAAKTWIGGGRLRVVIAGPAAVITPQLKGRGTVRVFDAEGLEVPPSAG